MKRIIVGFAMAVMAGVAVAANAVPFGFEVGVASEADVQKHFSNKGSWDLAGVNKFTQGKMYQVAKEALDVDGANSALFIFSPNGVLEGVVVGMAKDPKSLAKSFAGKYKPISNKIDNFMNYGYARYRKGDSFIEIDAPHLSFEMEVRYLTKSLADTFTRQVADEASAKKSKKESSL